MGAELGSKDNPLLVSCRSGARESMPGMMDTVLNIGLNEQTVQALAEHSGNETFAWDSYRRFIQMFGDVVLEVRAREGEHHDPFEALLEAKKTAAGAQYDSTSPPNNSRNSSPSSRPRSSLGPARTFLTIRSTRSGPPSELSSAVGTTIVRWFTAAITAFPTAGVLPATFKPWSSATSVTPVPPVSA
ncbi:MAG: hypothetical protein CM1200mP2_03750 [Planctomycetaceae bacterium]|nr:MAG: hypothetical protein CM1200mP2_03750 [Planctomycetaceae bacterium]